MSYALVNATKVKSLVVKCLDAEKKKWDEFCEKDRVRRTKDAESYLNAINAKNPLFRLFLTGKFGKITLADMERPHCGSCEAVGWYCNDCYTANLIEDSHFCDKRELEKLVAVCDAAIEMGQEQVILSDTALQKIGY